MGDRAAGSGSSKTGGSQKRPAKPAAVAAAAQQQQQQAKAPLTAEDREQLRVLFQSIDHNKDGLIDVSDLGRLLRQLNMSATEDELRAMISAQRGTQDDPTAPASINFDGFCAMMQRSGAPSNLHDVEDIRAVFGAIDKNRDGRISLDELRATMQAIGIRLSDADVKQMLAAADTNKDGFISFQEFAQLTNLLRRQQQQQQQQPQQQKQPQKQQQPQKQEQQPQKQQQQHKK